MARQYSQLSLKTADSDVTFNHFIEIDYSGAQTADSPLKGLQVFTASYGEDPVAICNPATVAGRFRNWTRRDIANMLADRIRRGDCLLIGIDHGFFFPETYFTRYGLRSWPAFLEDFCRYWPTHEPNCYVDFVREGNWWDGSARLEGQRIGDPSEFRLCERWTSSAKSVFQFDVQGSVAKSTHTGIP